MRALVQLMIIAVLQSALVSVARPVVASPLVTRSQSCANSPKTAPGTTFPRRSLASGSLEVRKSTNTVLWCAPNSRTYITLTMTRLASGSFVESALDTAAGYVAWYINQIGDAVIKEGSVECYGGNGVFFKSWNVNNNQQTWSVLAAAIAALKDFMSHNYYGGASFSIFDGRNEVGAGTVGL